jgi:hypothetical protein
MDFSSILKNETLRFLYSTIFPGVFVSFVLTLITGKVLNKLPLLKSLEIHYSYLTGVIFIFYVFIGGFIVEIIGVYIESKCIDVYVSKESNINADRFSFLWNIYLLIKRSKTEDLILVDYYRSILTKMKFLINLSVSLISSYIIIIVSHCVLNIDFFNLQTLEGFKGFVILGILVSVVSYFSFRRAKYCALLLFNAREKLIFHASL